MTTLEVIAVAICCWGLLGALCILSIGFYADIKHYIEIRWRNEDDK